jgi:DNA recombination protein RmuC
MDAIEASVRPLTAPELLALEETTPEEEATRRWIPGPVVDRTHRDDDNPALPGFDTQTG